MGPQAAFGNVCALEGPGSPVGDGPGRCPVSPCTGRLPTAHLPSRDGGSVAVEDPEFTEEGRKGVVCLERKVKPREVGLCVGFRWGMGKRQ